jgi:hypothetical protein
MSTDKYVTGWLSGKFDLINGQDDLKYRNN